LTNIEKAFSQIFPTNVHTYATLRTVFKDYRHLLNCLSDSQAYPL